MISDFLTWLFSLLLTTTFVASPTPYPIASILPVSTSSPVSSSTPVSTVAAVVLETKKEINVKTKPTTVATYMPVINNTPPVSGKYSKQSVKTDVGTFTVNLVAGDSSSTKIVVDTASQSDCSSNCPAMSLGDYVSRNGGWAGVNGTYFCPKDYPSCVGKENTFDLLVMNKDKYYFNSGNNVYSTNPAVIFGGGYVRFVNSGSQWGRDTGVSGVLMNYPLLVFNGNLSFSGDSDPKKGGRGSRSFVANKGNVVYIGVTQNVSVFENALVMKALGMDNALNLDSGGSTALWYGGYKIGPGRPIPNAIIFK